ncbi:MAG: hypothetical protein KAJ19_20610 [Gammaproteobacteria bacterium]|nr:hypothetical protein [Gammaproteobacteria bacterium]
MTYAEVMAALFRAKQTPGVTISHGSWRFMVLKDAKEKMRFTAWIEWSSHDTSASDLAKRIDALSKDGL